MTTTGDLRIDDWVVHRRNVVRSVAARVPGIDAEEATSRALEKMIRIVSTGGDITDPAPYWRRAALNEAISMTREQGRTTLVEDDTLEGLTPPADGAELDAERQADAGMLRTALADLDHDDRQILFDRHVHDKAVTDIATGLGVRPHAVTMRLRRAEERLAGAFAAAHAQAVTEPECRTTRAGMHDYLKGRMLPRRQHRLEVHMDGCADCTRAFIDVREVSWMLRDLGQHLIAGGWVTGAVGGAAAGTATVAGGSRPRTPGKKEVAVAAGVLAVLAVGGTAIAMVASQDDEPPAQASQDMGEGGGGAGSGGSGGGGGAGSGDDSSPTDQQPTQDKPPSIPPADPQPRPATTPKEDAAPAPAPVTEPEDTSDAAPEPDPQPAAPDEDTPSSPDAGGDPGNPSDPPPDDGTEEPDGGTDEPGTEEPPADPEPENPAPEEPETPEEPEVPAEPETPGIGTALDDLLASLGLSDLPGIDLATTTLDELWALLFGTFGQAADDAESAAGD